MKTDIILGGVGGQGILTIAMLVGRAAVASGLNVKQSEVHGMAQRGGAVFSHLRISDTTIHSDLVPRGGADVVLGVEPMEALRYVEYLKPAGILLPTAPRWSTSIFIRRPSGCWRRSGGGRAMWWSMPMASPAAWACPTR